MPSNKGGIELSGRIARVILVNVIKQLLSLFERKSSRISKCNYRSYKLKLCDITETRYSRPSVARTLMARLPLLF